MTDTEKRIADMERRIFVLEERTRDLLYGMEESDIIKRHGEYVDKTVAAKLLGVSRATVYAMLADGRIETGYGGKRVSVRSIAKFITKKTSQGQQEKAEGGTAWR